MMVDKNLIDIVFSASEQIKDNRTLSDIMLSLNQEVGELATEVAIINGHITNKDAGKDGVMGEAIDVIACALDIIKIYKPDVEQRVLHALMELKCDKWKKGKSTTINDGEIIVDKRW